MPPQKRKTQKKLPKKAGKAKKATKSKKTKPKIGKKAKKGRSAIKAAKKRSVKKGKTTKKTQKAKVAKKPTKKVKVKKKAKVSKKPAKTRTAKVKKRAKAAKKPVKTKKDILKTKQLEQYEKALKEFGRAIHEFNRRGFAEAKTRFTEIIKKYPHEQELSENARTYIRICDNNIERRSPRPRELDDFYHHGIMQLNNEKYKEAIKFFDKAISFDPKSEKVLYAKAAAFALSGNKEEAVSNLKAAIKYEPHNRIRAKTDPDFDSLRTDAEFNELIEPPEEIE